MSLGYQELLEILRTYRYNFYNTVSEDARLKTLNFNSRPTLFGNLYTKNCGNDIKKLHMLI